MSEEIGASHFVMAQWPHPLQLAEPPILLDLHQRYLHEKLRRKGSNVSRPAAGFRRICEHFGPGADPTQLKIADWAEYEDSRYAKGVQSPTVRRELTFHKAAMNHAHRRERIDKVPYIEMPNGEPLSVRRPATEAEFALLMEQGEMTRRVRLFFRIAYWTGHRAQAIEQLSWDRCDLERGVIDFNLPGARKTNKRRNGAFPITDALLPILVEAKAWRDANAPLDPYVIGAGKRGGPSCTGPECKAAWKSVGIDVKGLNRHALRKTFVTERLRKGKPRDIVAQLIADKPETMGKHYAVFVMDDMRAVANG